ncbi:unnamed protein product [Onchocerca ochengi]|uniref:Uncharacterized protein n=1 Tax=Onchocerca ochengi TaxID=42157 RepID=A0A182EEE5_ONCOC|nr:unnamed protein product [Onchocerca ochengi]
MCSTKYTSQSECCDRKENEMVSDQEKYRSDSNYRCTEGDKDDINDTNYDNMKLTEISMSSSSSSSTSSTSTTLKSAESSLNAKTLEKLSTYYRSTTTTPTSSAVTQESITESTTTGWDWGSFDKFCRKIFSNSYD